MAYNPRYTKFVRFARLAFPLLGVVLLAVVIFWTSFESPRIEPTQNTNDNVAETVNEVLVPEFDSVDEKGRPYHLQAQSAVQSETEKDLVLLQQPQGEIKLDPQSLVTLQARTGNMWRNAKKLTLNQNVTLNYNQAENIETAEQTYTLTSPVLYIDMNAGIATSDQVVNVTGPDIVLDATGMHADANNEVLIFEGPTKLVLKNGRDSFKGF